MLKKTIIMYMSRISSRSQRIELPLMPNSPKILQFFTKVNISLIRNTYYKYIAGSANALNVFPMNIRLQCCRNFNRNYFNKFFCINCFIHAIIIYHIQLTKPKLFHILFHIHLWLISSSRLHDHAYTLAHFSSFCLQMWQVLFSHRWS